MVHWAALLLSAVTFAIVKYKSSRRRAPLPPGPPADPLLGHVRSIPPTGQDIYFYKLGLEYGMLEAH